MSSKTTQASIDLRTDSKELQFGNKGSLCSFRQDRLAH